MKHILAVHPRNYLCKLCDQTFQSSINLECHLKDHDAGKLFQRDYCEWRSWDWESMNMHQNGNNLNSFLSKLLQFRQRNDRKEVHEDNSDEGNTVKLFSW